MSLRRLTQILTIAIVGLTLLAAVELIVVTTQLDRIASRTGLNMERVRAAEEIQLNLLLHARASFLHDVTAESFYGELEAAAAEDFLYWLERARTHVGDAEERSIVEELFEKGRRYFGDHRRLIAEGTLPLEVYIKSASSLFDAYGTAERLIEANVEQAHAARAEAARLNDRSNKMGIAVIVAIVAGIAAVLFVAERQVYRPLMSLAKNIRKFGVDTNESRLDEEGPAELKDIARAFNEMADILDRHRKNQLHFLAGVAHDLRNPLAAIKMSLNEISRTTNLNQEMHSILKMVIQEVEAMGHIINDLLDATRIEAGQFELDLQMCDLRGIAQQAFELFRTSSDRHRLALDVPDERVEVRGDPVRLGQVLNNLVSNAIKYSPRGGTVEISVVRRDPIATISVKDEGLGIAPEQQALIFEPFQRGELSTDTIPGVGLGLSVSRRIVEGHGGVLRVQSEVGNGATFIVELPVGEAPRSIG